MKTDTKHGTARIKNGNGGKTLKILRRLGTYHFHTKVPFNEGPKFKNRKHTMEWENGWKRARAYEQGYKAGLNGEKAKKNPYRDKAKNNAALRWWENGRQAALQVVKVYTL